MKSGARTGAAHLSNATSRLILAALMPLAVFVHAAAAQVQSNASSASSRPPPSSPGLLSLTEEERVWLRDHPVIRVAQDPSWPPIEFVDERGAPSGMTSDYLKLIEQRLGLKFEWVQPLSWQEAYARMKRWEIDMTPSVSVTSERETFWSFTKPYMTTPIVIVTRADVTFIADLSELNGKKVAVVEGYVSAVWISRDCPEIQLVRVKSTQEALAMLQRGEVFACVENMLAVGFFIAQHKITNLKLSGNTPYYNAQCMAVRKDWAILAGILDKALDSISEAERKTIYRRWLPTTYEYGLDYVWLWRVVAISAAVLVALIVWNLKLSREIRYRKRAESQLAQMNRLYGMLSQIDQAIVRAKQPAELYRSICDVAVKFGGFSLAWVGLLDKASGDIRPVAANGADVAQWPFETVNIRDGLFEDGLTATAVRRHAVVVSEDVENDERMREAFWQVRGRGLHSAAAIPIRLRGETVGALLLVSGQPGFFKAASEVSLLDEIGRDISFALDAMAAEAERKQAEETLRRLQGELEERVRERTAQLDVVNKGLGSFSYSVSHDLRAPLRAIDGFSAKIETSQGERLDAEGRRLLGIVRGNARKMSRLIDDLLTFSRIGRASLLRTRLAMKTMAQAAFEAAAANPEERARVDFRLGDLPEAEGDPGLINQVWVNLLSNAVKYSARVERPVIEVEGAVEGDLVVYRVSDNGAGFDMAYADKLFGVFQRLHGATEFEGTGIGLALVQQIVVRHGGKVWGEGAVGKGATFFFSLPVKARSDFNAA